MPQSNTHHTECNTKIKAIAITTALNLFLLTTAMALLFAFKLAHKAPLSTTSWISYTPFIILLLMMSITVISGTFRIERLIKHYN